MKRLFLIAVFVALFASSAFAQTPASISRYTIAAGANQLPAASTLTNKSVKVIDGSVVGDCGGLGGGGTAVTLCDSRFVGGVWVWVSLGDGVGSGTSYVASVSASSPLSSTGGSTPNISISDAIADGSTKGAASFTANDFNSSGGNISIDYTNGQAADTSHKGFLVSADWNTFNGKQNALSFGNLSDAGTDGITVSGGTGAVAGSGTSLSQHVADATHNGYLNSTDWGTFNAKQPAGNYITALTGDGSASGPGSVPFTLLNLPNGVTQAGSILVTDIAAPPGPAAGHLKLFGDSTDLRFHDMNAAGVVGTTVVPLTPLANSFLTGLNSTGQLTRAIPAFTDISGSAACSQLPALTGDISTSAGGCTTTIGALKVLNSMIANATIDLTAKVTGILPSTNGGTGVNNAGNITVGADTTITGGGTIALGGFTFTIPATGTAVLTSRTITEGNGLAGNTYDLSANRTLAMGTPSTLTVATSNSASGTTHTHAVTSSSNPGAAASLLASNLSGYLQLTRLGIGVSPGEALDVAGNIFIDQATANLFMNDTSTGFQSTSTTVVKLQPNNRLQSQSYASQTTGWAADGATGAGDFRYLFVDELHAKAFIADIEQALAGGQIITKSVAKVAADFTLPTAGHTTSFNVEEFAGSTAHVFVDGDLVQFRQITRGADTSLTIASAYGNATYVSRTAASGTTPSFQTYTIDRPASNGGSATGTINAGTLALDYGTTANKWGYWEVNAVDGANAANSPYAQIVTSSGTGGPAIQANRTVRTRLGNLNGITGVTEYGLYAGNVVDGTTLASTHRYIRLTDSNFELNNLDLNIYNSGNRVIALDYATPYFSLGATAPTSFLQASSNGIWMGNGGSSVYKMRVGAVSSGNVLTAGFSWDGSALNVIGSGTFSGSITATSGAIGGFSIGPDYIIDVGNSFGFASTVTGADDVRFFAGDTFVNRYSAPFRVYESGAVVASNITINGGGTFSGALSAATGTFAGSLSAATGTFAGSLSAATGTFAGSLSAASGTFAGSLTAASGAITGTLTMSGSGSAVAIGSTPPTSASAGTGLWIDRTGLYELSSGNANVSLAGGALTILGPHIVSREDTATPGAIEFNSTAGALTAQIAFNKTNDGSSGAGSNLDIWLNSNTAGTHSHVAFTSSTGTFDGIVIGGGGGLGSGGSGYTAPNAMLDVRGSAIVTGSLGTTGTRIVKGWFTDLQVTNAINGSVTGNAAGLSATLVVGSGGTGATTFTANKLLKGNTTSAISSSRVYDDGSVVGIGTTSPVDGLSVLYSGGNLLGLYRDLDVSSVGAVAALFNFGARIGSTLTPGSAIFGTLDDANTGRMLLQTRNGGTVSTVVSLGVGVQVGSPTGGDKGAGSINAVTVWRNGTSLDSVFESDYKLLPIDAMGDYLKSYKHLPTIPTKEVNQAGSTNLGALEDRLWETTEVHALYILQLNDRIKSLEAKVADLEKRRN